MGEELADYGNITKEGDFVAAAGRFCIINEAANDHHLSTSDADGGVHFPQLDSGKTDFGTIRKSFNGDRIAIEF